MTTTQSLGNGAHAEAQKKGFFKGLADGGFPPSITLREKARSGDFNETEAGEPPTVYGSLNVLHSSMVKNNPLLSTELQQYIVGSMVFFWKNGKYDGSIGQPKMSQEFFQKHADQIKEEAVAYLKSQCVMYEGLSTKKEEENKDRERFKNEAESYRFEVDKRKELYPKSYSLKLAMFYLVLALLLIFADLPLALKLTQYGFNLDMGVYPHALEHLFLRQEKAIKGGEGEILQGCNSDEGGIEHFFLVVANNWEVFVLAIGVALCAVYVKIFYDDFMGFPEDKAVKQSKILRRFVPSDDKDDSDATGKKKDKIKSILNLRKFAKVLILGFTLLTIVVLGVFRMLSVPEEDASQIFGYSWWITLVCFILLTVLFPVIGGIFLSLGSGILHNRSEMRFAERLFRERKDEYLKSLSELREVQKNMEICKQNLNCLSEGFQNSYSTFFRCCYEHGYDRGKLEPDRQSIHRRHWLDKNK